MFFLSHIIFLSSYLLISDSSDSRIITHWRVRGEPAAEGGGRNKTVVGGRASVHKWGEEHSLQALSAYIASSGADKYW